jgi:hypothetical protein
MNNQTSFKPKRLRAINGQYAPKGLPWYIHVAKSIIVAIFAAVLLGCILMWYQETHYKQVSYFWPIEPPFIEISYASGAVKRDLPALTPEIVQGQTSGQIFTGKASYYSHDGCLGCGENQTMANGQPFDETAMTLAVPAEWVKDGKIELNTVVSVTNLETGKRVLGAIITDTGGFAKYNRIADLSKALYDELGVQTDVTNIEIQVLPTLDQVQ